MDCVPSSLRLYVIVVVSRSSSLLLLQTSLCSPKSPEHVCTLLMESFHISTVFAETPVWQSAELQNSERQDNI